MHQRNALVLTLISYASSKRIFQENANHCTTLRLSAVPSIFAVGRNEIAAAAVGNPAVWTERFWRQHQWLLWPSSICSSLMNYFKILYFLILNHIIYTKILRTIKYWFIPRQVMQTAGSFVVEVVVNHLPKAAVFVSITTASFYKQWMTLESDKWSPETFLKTNWNTWYIIHTINSLVNEISFEFNIKEKYRILLDLKC